MREKVTESPMQHYAERIRLLREGSGRSHAEVTAATGINLPSYFDVEAHDDEIENAVSLAEAGRLAHVLGIALHDLLAPACITAHSFTFDVLASRLRAIVEREGLAAVEDTVGWEVDAFLADPASAWNQPIVFLKDVCGVLGVDWTNAIPAHGIPPLTQGGCS